MAESQQKKLSRVRKPRVHITYDVETNGAMVKKELPFVVGVMGDFSGHPTQPKKKLKDRNFIQIDRDNFNDVMTRMTPGLNIRVDNTLADDGTEMAVQLKFESMGDFDPASVIEQVPALQKLMETRKKLTELQTKVDLADELESRLEELLSDAEKLKQAGSQRGGAGGEPEASASAEGGSGEGGDSGEGE